MLMSSNEMLANYSNLFSHTDNLKQYELSTKLLEGSAEPALSVIYSSASRPSYKVRLYYLLTFIN